MDDAITAQFEHVIGVPCWGVDRVQGSILAFEFGPPSLTIGELRVSKSPFPEVASQLPRRLVKPRGAWQLLVFMCRWRIDVSDQTVAHDESDHDKIERAIHFIDGQKLTSVSHVSAERSTIFVFDLGAVLTTWPYEAPHWAYDDEQWSLYLSDDRVLTYRADGRYSLGPSDANPDQEIWLSL